MITVTPAAASAATTAGATTCGRHDPCQTNLARGGRHASRMESYQKLEADHADHAADEHHRS